MVANKNNPLWPFAIHSQRKSNFQSMRRYKWYDMNVYENNRKNCKQAISTSKDAIIFLSILIRFHLVKYRLKCQNILNYSSMLAIVFVSRQILYKKTRAPWTATPSLIKLNEKGQS